TRAARGVPPPAAFFAAGASRFFTTRMRSRLGRFSAAFAAGALSARPATLLAPRIAARRSATLDGPRRRDARTFAITPRRIQTPIADINSGNTRTLSPPGAHDESK